MLLIRILCVAPLINFFVASNSQSVLKDYYLSKIDLTEDQILHAIEETLEENYSEHLIAYAHYLKALRLRRKNQNFDAYECYDTALKHLLKADTADVYLRSAILRNQGVILENHGLFPEAASKQEMALILSYYHSKERGISTKYNLAWALSSYNPERALLLFFEALDEAAEEGLKDRQARIFNQIGLMSTRSQEYNLAIEYFLKGEQLAESRSIKADIIHNTAQVFFLNGELDKQQDLLSQSLKLRNTEDRFWALRDIGQSYLREGRIDEAKVVLYEAERYYSSMPLNEENIKIFEWLLGATNDSSQYAYKAMLEYKKLADQKQKLEALLKMQAMKNLVDKLAANKERDEKIALYSRWAIIGFSLAIFIFLLWRYRKYRLRKNIEQELIENHFIRDS